MDSRRFFLFTTLLLLVNFPDAAVAQPAPATASQSAPNQCEQFKAVVIKPDNTIDYKLRVSEPDETMAYKGRVINPCDQKFLVKTKPLPIKPLPDKVGQLPTTKDQEPFTAESRLKAITEIVTSSEMLKRARLAQEQKDGK